MSALQSRPAIQVAPVVFVTQTVVPVALAPVLFGERFSATPLDGVPLGVSLAVLIAGAALLARSPLLLALMEGERVSHRERLGAETRRAQPGDDALQPEHRGWRSVELDHQDVAGAHRALRQRARRAQSQRALDRDGPGGAREHQLTDREPATGLQVVEAGDAGPMHAPASAARRACAPSAAAPSWALPARSSSPSERSSAIRPANGTRASSAKETWIPRAASSEATSATSPAGACTITPTSGWFGVDADEWMDMQELGRHRGHLVGGHHPRAQPEQEHQLGRERHQPQSPERDRPHPSWRLQHHLDGGGAVRVGQGVLATVGPRRATGGEARLDVRAQLVGVVGQAQQVKRGHRARVQARVADRQTV